MNMVDFQKEILKTIHRAKAGDIGLSLAYADLIHALYLGEDNGKRLLNYDPEKPQSEKRDYVVLSNKAVWPTLSVILRQAGFLLEEREAFSLKISGVEAVTGLPGAGLSIAWGMAQSLHISKKSNRVYVFLDEDDLSVGQVWEAAMGIAYDRLDNLVGICAYTGCSKLEPLQDKFEAFGWKVIKLVDGHSEAEIVEAIVKTKDVKRQPTLILAPTILGKGIPFAEGKQQYRGVLFSETEMKEAQQFLK